MELLLTFVILISIASLCFMAYRNKKMGAHISVLASDLNAANDRIESIRAEMNELLNEYDELQAENRSLEKQYTEQVSATNKANGKAGALARQVNKLLSAQEKEKNKTAKNNENHANTD